LGSKDADEEDDQSVKSFVSTMSYKELRAECKRKGLSTNGKTEVLRKRLEAIEERSKEEKQPKALPAKVEVATTEPKSGSISAGEEDVESVTSVISTMSYKDLRNECKKKGLKATGKKEMLQKRLLELEAIEEDSEGPPLEVTTSAPSVDTIDDVSVVSGMSYRDLRKKCKELGIGASGKADDLKKRILEKLAEEGGSETESEPDEKPSARATAADISTPVRTSRSHMPSEGTSAYTPSRDAQVQTQHGNQGGTVTTPSAAESPSRDVPVSVKGAPESPTVSSIASSPDALKRSRRGRRPSSARDGPESKKQKVGDVDEAAPSSTSRRSARKTRGKR